MSNDPTNNSPEGEQAYSPRRAARAARARTESNGWGTHTPAEPPAFEDDSIPVSSTLRAAEAALLAAATERAAEGVRKQAEAKAAQEQAEARRLAAEEKGRREYEAIQAKAAAAEQAKARAAAATEARLKAAAEAEEKGRREFEAIQAREELVRNRAEAEERGRREYEALRARQAAEKQSIAAASAQRARDEAAAAQSEAAQRIRQTMAAQRQRQHAYAHSPADAPGTESGDSRPSPDATVPAETVAPAPALPIVPAAPASTPSFVPPVPVHEEHDEADPWLEDPLEPAAAVDDPAEDIAAEPTGSWTAEPAYRQADETADVDETIDVDHEDAAHAFAGQDAEPDGDQHDTQDWEAEDYAHHPALEFVDGERENVFLTGGPGTAAAARKKRRTRRNVIMMGVLGGFIVLVLVAVLFLQSVIDRLNPQDFVGPGGAPIAFEVKQGWGPLQIGASLQEKNIVASKKLFVEAVNLVEAESKTIHPGKYELREEMPALAAATILVTQGNEKVGYVAIKQNTRIGGVMEEVSSATGIALPELEKLSGDPAAFGLPAGLKNLEGFLHPGEYRFPLDADAKTVLKMMVDATKKELKDEGITDPDEQYRVLKIASILQAEARPAEYAIVAGALENRLHPKNVETNGLLQVDSTVIYGLDRYTLQMTAEEKADASNPFNSYVHKGLPPTPIGSPGNSAIAAAVNPKVNDFYYWVTVNTNTGETKFAKTYAEHLVNQNQFRSWCAANKDVCK